MGMRSILKFLKTTLLGGILVLLPLAGCVYVLAVVVKAVVEAVKPVASMLPKELGGQAVADLLVVGILVTICFLLGLLVPTTIGKAVGKWLENTLLRLLPGYQIVRRLTQQLGGRSDDSLGAPVLVQFAGSRQFGFLVEERADEAVVFIPMVPTPSLGTVHIVRRDAVTRLNASLTSTFNCLSQFGVGTTEILDQRPAISEKPGDSRQ
jgi:uncharacterized membrane protein